MKSVLLICKQSPWNGLSAREALDIALAGGAFDLPVKMLWLGEGIYQLAAGQQPGLLEQKNLQQQLTSLPLFGVESLYACAESLASRQLDCAQLVMEEIRPLQHTQIQQLLADSARVLVF